MPPRSRSPGAPASSPATPGTPFDARHSPGVLRMLVILVHDSLIGLLLLVQAIPGFLADWARQLVLNEIPASIHELVDVETYSRVSGRRVVKVEYADQKEQHANSSERAWLRVRYEGEANDTLVFAKCAARDLFVRSMMSMFDVYRNELNAYANIKMPVTTPKAHVAKWSRSRFVLVLEDLSSQGVTFPNIWSTHVDKKLGCQVLTALAKIHATFWGDKLPAGVWTDANRPYYGIGMGFYTLYNVEKRCRKDLFTSEQLRMYRQALWHWMEYRKYLSSKKDKPFTMCHGDSHMGNFYIKKDGSIGTFDFQVLSEENPMRDLAYFLSSSYDPDLLEKEEKELIRFYLDKLEEFGVPAEEVPSFEQAWFGYRVQQFLVLYAFVFSGGFSNLMDHVQTECGVSRILRVMDRVDSQGALYDVLDGRVTWQ